MPMRRPWLYLAYLLYCAEAGIYLLLVPWSALWGPLLLGWPARPRALLATGMARGGISALGGLLLVVCLIDLVRFCRGFRSA
ncbi:MAG TPA: hypothetical protein VGS03_00060 [Candidatus Polarisedimenticolia bacterium]|nr:hypothetical protein [Candidatus Polarisedimenticolia bacterium]